MEQRIIFRQTLLELKELAGQQGDELTTDQIDEHLAHARLSREQLGMVYEYLSRQGIRIPKKDGAGGPELIRHTNTDAEGPERSREEENGISQSLQLYLRELARIDTLDPALELELFHRTAAGDREAREELISAWLPMICDLAGEYGSGELPLEDLIQEGNMGLILSLSKLEHRDSLAAYQAGLMNAVSACVEEARKAGEDVREQEREMERKVNHLHQAMRHLKEDLGRNPSLDEISAYLDMPMEELLETLRLAGDELN